jgi:hypothetical protein
MTSLVGRWELVPGSHKSSVYDVVEVIVTEQHADGGGLSVAALIKGQDCFGMCFLRTARIPVFTSGVSLKPKEGEPNTYEYWGMLGLNLEIQFKVVGDGVAELYIHHSPRKQTAKNCVCKVQKM